MVGLVHYEVSPVYYEVGLIHYEVGPVYYEIGLVHYEAVQFIMRSVQFIMRSRSWTDLIMTRPRRDLIMN